jgi:hypothetical protein
MKVLKKMLLAILFPFVCVIRTCNITEGNATTEQNAVGHNITSVLTTSENNSQPAVGSTEKTACSPPPSYLPPEVGSETIDQSNFSQEDCNV